MSKREKNKRTLENIGKKQYDFDMNKEKTIYSFLCCRHINKKSLRVLDEELKFNSYMQWKQYICSKYKNYSYEALFQFSRYLNQRIRDIKSFQDFWYIFVSVIVTMLLTQAIVFFQSVKLLPGTAFIVGFIITILAFVITVVPIVLFLRPIIKQFYYNNTEENMFKDYKEIIDELLAEKLNCKMEL